MKEGGRRYEGLIARYNSIKGKRLWLAPNAFLSEIYAR
jgi:hypothetical protein